MPRASVCIPTYNGAAFLGQTIGSVLAQTLTDFELIVVDDQSTDGSAAIAHSFDDPRLRVYQNDSRLGLVGNWNRCLELVQSEHVCLFHQDDIMLPANLAAKIEVLEQYPQVGLVYSNVFIIDVQGRTTANQWYYQTIPDEDFVQAGHNFFEQLIAANNIICCPSVIARKACYETLGGFDPRLPFATDWEMWLRIALFYQVGYLAEPLINYRQHEENETLKFSGAKDLAQCYLAKTLALEKYPERVPNASALKVNAALQYVQNALQHVLYHYRRGEYRYMRPYLAFILSDKRMITRPVFWVRLLKAITRKFADKRLKKGV